METTELSAGFYWVRRSPAHVTEVAEWHVDTHGGVSWRFTGSVSLSRGEVEVMSGRLQEPDPQTTTSVTHIEPRQCAWVRTFELHQAFERPVATHKSMPTGIWTYCADCVKIADLPLQPIPQLEGFEP